MKRIDIHVEGLSVEARNNLAQSVYAAFMSAGRRAVGAFAFGVAITCVIFFGTQWVLFELGVGRDDTDGKARSGLNLYTDHATGCQYLGNGSGLTPRMDAQGYQMCGKENGDKQ
ncbi:hypothetical protein DPU24_02520 [Salmonella enterica subsp. enterica serovar Oranienburg]|nr:hypothetical protein [Salmonella enterica subsp. enterica serovar Oranienburg]